jgi:hypothetical protein
MRDILENPRSELIGCVLPDPIRVDRTFRDGERLSWEEFEFTIHYTPGHADYHMGMFAQIDGHSVAFSGDNVFPLGAGTPSLIYRNHVHKTSHQQTARLFLEYSPDVLCAGHDLQTEVQPVVYQRFATKALQLTQLFESLLPGEANFGLEPSWVQIRPYQPLARPGDTLEFEVRVTNFDGKAADALLNLVLPGGWTCSPDSHQVRVSAGKSSSVRFDVTIPSVYRFKYPRVAIAVDVTFNGRRLGQISEAVVECEG